MAFKTRSIRGKGSGTDVGRGGGLDLAEGRALFGTHLEYAPGQLLGQLEQLVVLLGVVPDVFGSDAEHVHVAHEVQQLVEADVLVRQFLPFLLPAAAPRLDIPDVDGGLLLLDLDPGLLVDGLEESGLPPADVLPDAVVLDEFLEFYFAVLVLEVVGD